MKNKNYITTDEITFNILVKKIDKLQLNWNSLREWLLKDTKDTFFQVVRIKDILDKMKELEGKENDK